MAKAKYVPSSWGIFGICATVLTTVFFGAAFATEYKGECTPAENGEVECNHHFAWKGFAGIPIEALAGAAGPLMGAYISYRSARREE